MGDYAAFVTAAWAISAIVLGGVTLETLLRARRWRRRAERRDAEPGA